MSTEPHMFCAVISRWFSWHRRSAVCPRIAALSGIVILRLYCWVWVFKKMPSVGESVRQNCRAADRRESVQSSRIRIRRRMPRRSCSCSRNFARFQVRSAQSQAVRPRPISPRPMGDRIYMAVQAASLE